MRGASRGVLEWGGRRRPALGTSQVPTREALGRGPGLIRGSATDAGWTRRRRRRGNPARCEPFGVRGCARKNHPEAKNRREAVADGATRLRSGRAARRCAICRRCSPRRRHIASPLPSAPSGAPPPLMCERRKLRKTRTLRRRENATAWLFESDDRKLIVAAWQSRAPHSLRHTRACQRSAVACNANFASYAGLTRVSINLRMKSL
jgi:hypothetical protein